MRDESRQVAQPKQRNASLNQSNHRCHHDGGFDARIGWHRGESALSMAIEIAFVGPLISCLLEANKAPTAVITMAVYSPN